MWKAEGKTCWTVHVLHAPLGQSNQQAQNSLTAGQFTCCPALKEPLVKYNVHVLYRCTLD